MKKIFLFLVLLCVNFSFSQEKYSLGIGSVTKEELELTVYKKDSTVNAVVLNDYGNTFVDKENDYLFRTDYYQKIKFFNKEDIEKATITHRLYGSQKIEDIKAVTYNLKGDIIKKIYLLASHIFTKDLGNNIKEVSFTLPNIQPGCVIEYSYTYLGGDIKDWYFQSDIPVVNSEIRFAIPGNFKYDARIIGFKKLDKEEAHIARFCLKINGISEEADCTVLEYGMKDIPAFKEEDHMLSQKNFLSSVIFERKSFIDTRGVKTKYSQTWDDADKSLKKWFFDNQTSKKSFFKRQISSEIMSMANPLEKAKKVFYQLQKRFFWDGYFISKKVKVKETYESKTGNIAEINLALYNMLQVIGIESYMVVLSTRNNGLPTKLHPSFDIFNYAVVKAVINGESYFLDATDKFLPFGQVPMRCLNGEGRVLDFKKGSYWEIIESRFKTSKRLQFQLEFNEDEELEGQLVSAYNGYYAIDEKKDIKGKTKDERLDDFETKYPNIEANTIEVSGDEDNESTLLKQYKFNMDVDEMNGLITINPFLFNQKTENPFKLNERLYPVDFGYTRSEILMFNFKIPEGYIINSFPESVGFALPNQGGKYVLKVNKTDTTISLLMRYVINKKLFSSEEYFYLKEFYKEIINSQKALIVLKKI